METAMTRESGSAVDPVCGMAVDPNAAAGTASFKGQAYWFCSTACLTAFRADPAKFVPTAPFGWGTFLYGLVGVAIAAFVTGVVYAVAHNLLGPRSAARG
jgi:YHS domain-containing protein